MFVFKANMFLCFYDLMINLCDDNFVDDVHFMKVFCVTIIFVVGLLHFKV